MDETLDAKGLLCPLPVLRAKKCLKTLPLGGILRIEATDPGALTDFPKFCEQTGYELVEASQGDGGVLVFRIRRTT